MLYGYDYASHQGDPDWSRLAVGHDFAISKVTGEGNYVNPHAAGNLRRSHDAGLITGAYDWTEPQRSGFLTGAQMAEDYLRVLDAIDAWRPGFLLCVDWETPEWFTGPLGRNVEPLMREYFYTLRDKNKGKLVPIVYSADYFSRETGARNWAWLGKDFPYWQAAPGPATGPHNMTPDDAPWPGTTLPWAKTLIHQHQWYASSPGLVGQIDRNRFRGTRAELLALGYQGAGGGTGGGDEVQVPPEGKWSVQVMPNGNTVMALNFGGETTPDGIVGVAIKDVGVSVKSKTEPGEILDRSFKDETAQQWNERGLVP